jgi:hypothetical protein
MCSSAYAAFRYSTTWHFGIPALNRCSLPDRPKKLLLEGENPIMLTITHTHAEGTLIEGTSKGGGTAEALKANAWRWGRSISAWSVHPVVA